MRKSGAQHSSGVAALTLIADNVFKALLLFQMTNVTTLRCLRPSQSDEKRLLLNSLQIKSPRTYIFFVHFE